jgi:hypothetical protein
MLVVMLKVMVELIANSTQRKVEVFATQDLTSTRHVRSWSKSADSYRASGMGISAEQA